MENNTNKTLKITIIALGIVALTLIIVCASLFSDKNALKQELEAKNEAVDIAYNQLDSLTNELDSRIRQMEELGADVEVLEQAKAELEIEKKNLLRSGRNYKNQINELKKKVKGYTKLLVEKDDEIKNLKEANELLTEENVELKNEKIFLNDSISKLEQNRSLLQNKVVIASKLKVSDFLIKGISNSGKERIAKKSKGNLFKKSHIKDLKIEITVDKNEVAEIGNKEVILRVIAPNQQVIFDVEKGSGSFTFDNREIFYTSKQEMLYERTQQKLSFIYSKGSYYESGKYKIEVYSEDFLIGSDTFIVK